VKKNMKKTIAAVVVIIAAVAGGAGFWMWHTVQAAVDANASRIIKNVRCGRTDVGGMTKTEAEKAVRAFVGKNENKRLVLRAGHRKVSIPFKEAGICFNEKKAASAAYDVGRSGTVLSRFLAVRRARTKGVDVGMKASLSAKAAKKLIRTHEKGLIVHARNASVEEKDGKGVVKKGRKGHKIVYKASVAALRQALAKKWDGRNLEVKLTVAAENPAYTEDKLKDCTDILGTYETDYAGSVEGRCRNIVNGTRLINGTVVEDGKLFSVYDHVAPFTAENGYYPAPTISGEKHIDDYGGGICQVSTTLYNAVIRAELKVKERHNHSQAIGYVPLSADAAIAGNTLDFKFENTSGHRIYIKGRTRGQRVKFTIFGKDDRPDNRTVDFESVTTSVTVPTERVVERNSALPAGTKQIKEYGATGYTAQLWKVVRVNGKVRKRTLFNHSAYQMVPTKVIEGTKKEKEEKKKTDKSKKDGESRNKDKENAARQKEE